MSWISWGVWQWHKKKPEGGDFKGPPPEIGLNSLRVVQVNGGGRSAECVRNMDTLKMGGGPAHKGARSEGDDPPEMKFWLRHWDEHDAGKGIGMTFVCQKLFQNNIFAIRRQFSDILPSGSYIADLRLKLMSYSKMTLKELSNTFFRRAVAYAIAEVCANLSKVHKIVEISPLITCSDPTSRYRAV